MEHIYRHYQDPDGKASINGAMAQNLFESSAKAFGFEVKKTSLYNDKYNHQDYVIAKDGLSLTTDVKFPKRITRQDKEPSKDWVWVEFVGTTGHPGWIYGNQQTVSFLMPDFKNFMLVNRNDLRKLCENICSDEKVSSPTNAYYKKYTRSYFGAKDVISLIKYQDIKDNCFCTYIPVSN